MMLIQALKTSGAAILGWTALQANGFPTGQLAPRKAPNGLKAGINIAQLVIAVIDYLKDDNAYVSIPQHSPANLVNEGPRADMRVGPERPR